MPQPYTEMHPAAGVLTQQDIDRLLQEDSPDTRCDILGKISNSYNAASLSSHERLYAEQIFRLLMRDTETAVREALAESLKDNPDVPRDVVLQLVNDDPSVAVSMLESSQVLSDADLIRLVETSREMEKLTAVARRINVSDRVCGALVDTSYPQVVSTLLANESSQIGEENYVKIVTNFADDDMIHQHMVSRESLPLNIAASMMQHASEVLCNRLRDRFGDVLDQATQQLHETLTLDLIDYQSSEEEVDALVQNMARQGSLSVSIVFSSLCRGYLSFFNIAMARMAGIPKSNARRLIEDPGKKGFLALYETTELPESMYSAIRLLLDIVLDMRTLEDYKPGTAHYCDHVIGELVRRSHDSEVENLSYVIALVRNSARR